MLTQVWIIAVASVQLPFNVIAVKSVRSHFYACITQSIFHNKQGKLSEQNGNLNKFSDSFQFLLHIYINSITYEKVDKHYRKTVLFLQIAVQICH